MTSPFFSCRLENRSVVRIGGADRRAFLQSLISNDIGLVTSARAIYAALLTPQGKFLFDLFIIEASEEFLIDIEAARAEDFLKRLAAYKLRAKVTLRNARGEFEVWGIREQGSEARGGGVGVRGEKVFADPRLPELGVRAIVETKGFPTPNPQPPTPDFFAYDQHRLALGVADGSRDLIVEKSTLADGNFDLLNGISWSKGCYVGQELTARMHYRALVKKRLFPVTIAGVVPAFGAPVKFGNEDAGDMRSYCGTFGLALLNIEKAEAAIRENGMLVCGESRLAVSKPGWMGD